MTHTKTCPRCGTSIRSDEGPAGLCAACLMKMGLESRSGPASAVFAEEQRVERPQPPTVAELAPHFPELEILDLVGRGGMGAVYRARQRSLQRELALKILTVGAGDATFADRFQREAHTLASLSHPGIVAVFDFGSRGPWSFLTMEFVEGASLRQMMRARTLGTRESLTIVSQMCEALQYAHDQGVVHRDIKPENVLVTRDGRVKVLDFGLAKLVGIAARPENLTQPSQVMGTPHYMAPEQWEKPLTVDHRADIYAMGVVFYELLTGELPLGRFEPPSHKVALDLRLDDVVLRSLEKEPSRRYQHASEVRDDVAGITSTPGGAAAQALASPEPKRRNRSKWLVAGALGGCLVLLAIPLLFTFLVFMGPRSEVQKAESAAALQAAERKLAQSGVTRAPDSSGLEQMDARKWTQDGTDAERTQEAAGAGPSTRWDMASCLKDLNVDPGTANYFGIDSGRTPELNATLARVWSRYLEREQQLVMGNWLGDDQLHMTAQQGQHHDIENQRAEVHAIIRGEIASTRPMPRERDQILRSRIAEVLRFGTRGEAFDMRSDEEGAFIVTTEGEALTTTITAHSGDFEAYRRVWSRMLPSRQRRAK